MPCPELPDTAAERLQLRAQILVLQHLLRCVPVPDSLRVLASSPDHVSANAVRAVALAHPGSSASTAPWPRVQDPSNASAILQSYVVPLSNPAAIQTALARLQSQHKDSTLTHLVREEALSSKLHAHKRRSRQAFMNHLFVECAKAWASEEASACFQVHLPHIAFPDSTTILEDLVDPSVFGSFMWLSKGNLHREWLSAVLTMSRSFHDAVAQRHATRKKLLRQVVKQRTDKERMEVATKERLALDRISALKRNDEQEYLKLLKKTKSKRLKLLIEQTDEYLRQIGEKVKAQKLLTSANMAHIKEIAVASAAAAAAATTTRPPSPSDEAAATLPPDGDALAEDGARPVGGDDDDDGGVAAPEKISYYASIHSIMEKIDSQPKLLVGGSLKSYQLDGLLWLVSLHNNRLNGILADEMGLGKTIQTIALICYLVESKSLLGPYLIVVPLMTISNWTLEFKKWAPGLFDKLVIYKGSPAGRKSIYQTHMMSNPNFAICITTFDYIIKDRSYLSRIKWAYLIVDEGHRMKNHTCKLSTTFSKYYESQFRLILTGTPLQNSLPELWSLLNFLLPSIFNSVETFDQWFNKPFINTGEKVEMNEEETLLVIQRLHKLLRPFLLRRLKIQVEAQLPEKVERVIKCEMSIWQRRMYDMALQGILLVEQRDGGVGTKGLMNTLMQLRKICNHPFIFKEHYGHRRDDMLWRASGKIELLDRILPKLKVAGHRVLLFSQMTVAMDILEEYFYYRRFSYLRLDGSTKADMRGDLLAMFNAQDSPYFLFVLSTRAGGLGLNLQTADTVILFDSDWNPQADLQAQDRAHRIGQKNDVLVLRFVSISSIEEKILGAANFKLDLDSKIIQAGMFNNNSTSQDRKNFLMSLLKSSEEEHEDNDVPDNEQINRMISRSEAEYHMFREMDRESHEQRLADWIAAGHGDEPLPSRLVEEHEIPKYLRIDYVREKKMQESSLALNYGRGRRKHASIRYYDDDDENDDDDDENDDGRGSNDHRNRSAQDEGLAQREGWNKRPREGRKGGGNTGGGSSTSKRGASHESSQQLLHRGNHAPPLIENGGAGDVRDARNVNGVDAMPRAHGRRRDDHTREPRPKLRRIEKMRHLTDSTGGEVGY